MQCSGGPSPCELCQKFATHCHFNPKLDTRRKVSYKSSEKHDIRGYILESTLQVLKRGKTECVESLLRTIRSDASIEDIAASFQQNFKILQSRGIIPHFKIDESDIISLALQGLFPYRVGCVQGDLDSDTEPVHVPHSSPSQPNPHYCDYPSDDYISRSGQKVQHFQDAIRKSPMNGRTVGSNAIPNGSFNSTAYSSFSDDFSDFPPTPLSQSPQFYYDGVHGSQSHLTPYSSGNQSHATTGHEGSYPIHVPVLVSQQPPHEKQHLPHSIQGIPNWPPNTMPMNTSGVSWHQNHSVPVTSTGIPVQLASHNEPVYWAST